MPDATPHSPEETADGAPAAQRVLEALRGRIVRGELGPGARIVERAICAELGVSRTPLREALKLLEIDGLIDLSQNRGGRVRPFTEAEATQLFEVLAGLESIAAELATERMTPAGLARLEALHLEMRERFATEDLDRYFALNSLIHETIIAATGNDVLISVHRGLMLRAKRGRYMAILDRHRWEQAMDEHEDLIDAVRRRNAADAGRIWRAHLIHTGQTVAAVLRRDASKDPS
ncbi:GntR family transcriptional regulator [Acuticoccus sp. I52.16.1]|uniref:GntR family transcriptional regulator n=1 Tax=Acuticoccus sp. I52.16.1 TaxID=2928472 RepID=UPI001FD190FD|nr:GntR family transcriptional regulator [Acuticoccus sp. I52.16.1]UOM36045.1 GntR family transcriptional regulator [Acuticoccus sp. I52.16.1]